MPSIRCTSISSVVSQWLQQGPCQARVLARFDKVVNITLEYGSGTEVLALCSPAIGNGPLNVLLDPWPDWGALTASSPVVVRDQGIALGGRTIDCAAAPRWDPLPDWAALRQALGTVGMARLRRAAIGHSLRSPVLALICGLSTPSPALMAGLGRLDVWWWSQDPNDLGAAVETLAGLGAGLTPTGDDFLCGVELGMWATQRLPQSPCRLVADRAAPLTTLLSAAFLRRAAAGEVNAAWLALLDGVCAPLPQPAIDRLVGDVVSVGCSSGADLLAGFLWLCHSATNDRRRSGQCA